MARKATEEEKVYIKRYKALSGDTTPQGGLMTVRKGLLNRYVCRLCGKVIPYGDVDRELDKLTGYCRSCMARLRKIEDEQAAEHQAKTQHSFRIAGTTFREKAILKLSEANDLYNSGKNELLDEERYDERVYKYVWPALEGGLALEPDNPEDPGAIKVLAEGVHVGYIKRGDKKKVRELMEGGTIVDMTVYMEGGRYKILTQDDDDRWVVDGGEAPIWGDILIITRE